METIFNSLSRDIEFFLREKMYLDSFVSGIFRLFERIFSHECMHLKKSQTS